MASDQRSSEDRGGYKLDNGLTLDVHPDAVRLALGVFEYFGGSSGPRPEEAMARALVAAQSWAQRYKQDDAARDRRLADLDAASRRAAVRLTLTGGGR